MRILFLTDHHLDYASDPLYVGLTRVLGEDLVLDYPYKASFHEPEAVPWYLVPRRGRHCSHGEILDLLRDGYFDLACIASFREDCLAECGRLNARVRFPPTVFIDGSDDARIRTDLFTTFGVKVYFKRDYVWGMGQSWKDRWDYWWKFGGKRDKFTRTVPLPLSIVLEALPTDEQVSKDIDVSYRGRVSHPRRARAVEVLSGMRDIRFSGDVYASPGDRQYKFKSRQRDRLFEKLVGNKPATLADQQKKQSPNDYYKEIAASRIAVAIRGGGYIPSPRYLEIVALKTLLISDPPEAFIPNNFVDRRHAVFCKPDLSDLGDLVRRYLRQGDEREAMVQDAYAHLLKYHTCERRAEYFLEQCRRLI